MMAHSIAYATAIVLIVPGIFLCLVPMMPAISYMFLISLIYGLVDKFTTLTGLNLAILFAFVVASFLVDHSAGALGAKYGGAHSKSLLWGVAGSIIGTLTFPPFGSFIGLFAGVFIGEMRYRKTHGQAVKAASSALLGSLAGIATNVVLAIGFSVAFILFALR